MEDDETPKKRFSINGWEPRWGHIGTAIIIIFLVVLTWVVVVRSRGPKSVVTNTCTSSSTKVGCPVIPKPAEPKQSAPSTPSTSPQKPSTTPPTVAKSPGSTSSNSKALAGTGPGNVIELFVVTSFIGMAGYQLYLRYKMAGKRA